MADRIIINGLSTGQQNYDPRIGVETPPSRPTESVQATVDRRIAENNRINTYNFGTNPKYYVYMTCETYSRIDAMQLARTNITDEIIMPMPVHMIDAHRVLYAQEELTPLGGAAVNTLAPALRNMTFNNLNNIGTTVAQAGATGLAGAVGGGAAAGLSSLPAALQNPVRALAGIAPNQFLTILLKGPAYKKFTMEWTISPKSPEHARVLKNAITMIKNAQAPSLGALGVSTAYFFSFPKIFRLYFKPNDEYLYQFKPCVLEDAQFNYTGSGMFAPTRIGAPDTIKIVLNFTEVEFWLQGDFK